MKKIFYFLVFCFLFISCGKNKYVGTWVLTNWKDNFETLKIEKNNENYFVFLDNEKISANEEDNYLKLNYDFLNNTITVDDSTNILSFDDKEYIKVDNKIQEEMNQQIKKYKDNILGKWFTSNSSDNNEVYVTVTPGKETNTVNIKTETFSLKDGTKEKINESDGIITIEPNGRLVDSSNIFSSALYFITNAEDFKNLQKIK